MKYYSEELEKFFDTEEECEKAEASYFEELEAAKKQKELQKEEYNTRYATVEAAYKEFKEAEKNYRNLVNDFVKDYGEFHIYDPSNRTMQEIMEELFHFF